MKEYTRKVQSFLERRRDERQAESMSMASQGVHKFLGIKKNKLKELFKTIFKTYPLPQYDETKEIIRELFSMAEREYLYFGIALFARRKKLWQKIDIVFIENMLLSRPEWDTTEYISSNIISPFYEKYPGITSKFLDIWSASKNPWLKASTIIFQRTSKEKTDTTLLQKYITENISTDNDIVNKAIWTALRNYSKYNHKWVLNFIMQNSVNMSQKTKQEAIKWIDNKRLIN